MYYNDEYKYLVVNIPSVAANVENMKRITQIGVEKFKRKFNQINHNVKNDNITWQFTNYNVYGLCCCNEWFYDMYVAQINAIREYFKLTNTPTPRQLWLQSWINSHTPNQVLKSHNHDWPWHGYISIDPKNTYTVFTDKPNGTELYRIKNEPGNIYIGPGYRFHHIEIVEPFEGERVTFGFDLECTDRIMDNMGFVPVIL